MSDGFYRAFEERLRGSRELIKERVAAYLPFVEPLLVTYPSASAIDVGCGRGEWLEVLTSAGFKPIGVDLDSGMLEACHKLGLFVHQGDAIAYLSTLPDESQVVVSAFHVVEHITFDLLMSLIAEALRVLKPGGLLIMETPNPENIVVATSNFYLDPTHQRPIPPMLLAFVAEHAGFVRVKTLRLQESKGLAKQDEVSLQQVFSGVSPDYAVVAQKDATAQILAVANDPFSLDYGLSLENLLSRWDRRFNRLEIKAQQAEIKAQQLFDQTQALLSSTSWRITAPLRAASYAVQRIALAFRERRLLLGLKRRVSAAINFTGRWVLHRPLLKKLALFILDRQPGFRMRLRRIVMSSSVTSSSIRWQSAYATANSIQSLSPRARAIYEDLKHAVERVER